MVKSKKSLKIKGCLNLEDEDEDEDEYEGVNGTHRGFDPAFRCHRSHALPRSILNPSFEEVVTGTTVFSGQTPEPLPNTTFTTYSIASDDWFPGWLSTNGQIEMWVDGFQNRSASDGDYLVRTESFGACGIVPGNVFGKRRNTVLDI